MQKLSTENVDSISPGQCRAARGLLELTQPELAARAHVGLSTIVDFEKSRRRVSKEAVRLIERALEAAGIEFICENGGGPGVRLKKSQKGKPQK